MKASELYSRFGEFNSADEINTKAAGLLEEGDLDNLRILAEENGLSDMVELYIENELNQLTDDFMAAVGKLNRELQADEAIASRKRIPAEPIASYLQSQCEELASAKAIRRKGKSLVGCLKYIEAEARKIVVVEAQYLPDLTVFMMAADYYFKEV